MLFQAIELLRYVANLPKYLIIKSIQSFYGSLDSETLPYTSRG